MIPALSKVRWIPKNKNRTNPASTNGLVRYGATAWNPAISSMLAPGFLAEETQHSTGFAADRQGRGDDYFVTRPFRWLICMTPFAAASRPNSYSTPVVRKNSIKLPRARVNIRGAGRPGSVWRTRHATPAAYSGSRPVVGVDV